MEWQLIAIVAGIICALVGAVWAANRKDVDRIERRLEDHIGEDRKVHEQAAVNSAVNASEIRSIKAEIGDHNTGLRGWLHKLSNDISPYIIRRQHEDRDK